MSESEAKIISFPVRDQETYEDLMDLNEDQVDTTPTDPAIKVLSQVDRKEMRQRKINKDIQAGAIKDRDSMIGRLHNLLHAVSLPEDAYAVDENSVIGFYEDVTAHRVSEDESHETFLTWHYPRRGNASNPEERPLQGITLTRRENGEHPTELSLRLQQVGEDYDFTITYTNGRDEFEPVRATTALDTSLRSMNFFQRDYVRTFTQVLSFCKYPDTVTSNEKMWEKYQLRHPKPEGK